MKLIIELDAEYFEIAKKVIEEAQYNQTPDSGRESTGKSDKTLFMTYSHD